MMDEPLSRASWFDKLTMTGETVTLSLSKVDIFYGLTRISN
jgi:hypothetical protein